MCALSAQKLSTTNMFRKILINHHLQTREFGVSMLVDFVMQNM